MFRRARNGQTAPERCSSEGSVPVLTRHDCDVNAESSTVRE